MLTVMHSADVLEGSGKKWQSDDDGTVRRSVLLHILIVLKQKYGKVDQRISNIARRAELALYTRANSRDEYGNPRTLCKRLHALIVKLYAHQNEQIKKRKIENVDGCSHILEHHIKRIKPTMNADILLEGQEGVVRIICSYLETTSLVALSSTNHRARIFIPSCITSIDVHASKLPLLKCPSNWLNMFPNVRSIVLHGENRFGFGEIAMENIDMRSNLAVEWLLSAISLTLPSQLQSLALHHVYCDGLDDPLTTRLASLLSNLPSIQNLSLVGNCMTDVGAMYIARSSGKLLALNLDNNFIGERGVASLRALLPSTCLLSIQGNLFPCDSV